MPDAGDALPPLAAGEHLPARAAWQDVLAARAADAAALAAEEAAAGTTRSAVEALRAAGVPLNAAQARTRAHLLPG